jgi:hypothetical protein
MQSTTKRLLLIGLLSLLVLHSHVVAHAREPLSAPISQGNGNGLEDRLRQATGGNVRIAHHARTGTVSFISADQDHPIGRPASLTANASPEALARAFLDTYGQLFGVKDQAQALRLQRVKDNERGHRAASSNTALTMARRGSTPETSSPITATAERSTAGTRWAPARPS